MPKFIILGDMHIGVKNASPVLCEYQLRFFETQLFPYMEKHCIDTILQLGDLFDTRKFSNHVILHMWMTRFFDVIEAKKIKFITILGNHDLAYKNTLEVNSTSLFLKSYPSVKIIDKPTNESICGVSFLLLPWIVEADRSHISSSITNTESLFCAGHFEFSGFEVQKGIDAHGGEDSKNYDHFDIVFSGHYHTKHKKKNILYTGTPYEMSWADYGDQKGFHVFDTKKHKVDFVKNNIGLFYRLEYNDKNNSPDLEYGLGGSYVKVVVINKTDPHLFEKYINHILLQNPTDLKITDIDHVFDSVDVSGSLKLDDTKTIMDNFIDKIETELDKKKIKDMMHSLYMNSLEKIE